MPENRIILHVDMDYFFAQCEEREHPELKGKPVVVCVYSGRTGDSGAVSTSNYEARKFGIKAGIPISRAKKLNPDAIFLPVNMELYRKISDEVMEILRGFSDVVEQESIDEAFCDITGKVADFDGAKDFAAKIKKDILDKLGLTCSVGAGPNKLVAKIASDFRKPDGLTVVKPEDVRRFLESLKVTDLIGVGKKTGERLDELGINTIGDMSKLSEKELIREFGQAKGTWLRLASLGIDGSPVQERGGSEQIGRITTLKEDTRDMKVIFDTIDVFSRDVFRKLDERKLSFRSVAFIGITTDFKTHTKSRTLAAPARDAATIKKVANELAEDFLSEHQAALRRVGIRVADFIAEKAQTTLEEF